MADMYTKLDKKLVFKGEASALMYDLRNSTQITMLAEEANMLDVHVEFMLNLNKSILEFLESSSVTKEFSFNDTGDGCLVVCYDKNHPLTCFKIALQIYQYLNIQLKSYLGTVQGKLPIKEFNYGMAIHCGPCMIGDIYTTTRNISKKVRSYIFGVVANSVARLESFSKNYVHDNFLTTGGFRKELIASFKDADSQRMEKWTSMWERLENLGEVHLKDFKNDGHWVLSFTPDLIEEMLYFFELHRFSKFNKTGT